MCPCKHPEGRNVCLQVSISKHHNVRTRLDSRKTSSRSLKEADSQMAFKSNACSSTAVLEIEIILPPYLAFRISNTPSNMSPESHNQGQDNSYATYPSTPAGASVPYPRLANQGSNVHCTGTSPPEEPCRIRTLGQKPMRPDSSEPSGSNQRVARSPSPAPGVAQGPEPYNAGVVGAAGGRRNAICSEAIKEYLATHPLSEKWGPDDEDDSYILVKRHTSPSTPAGQLTVTAAMQRLPSSTLERSPTRPSPTGAAAMTRALRGTTAASVADDKDDETSQIGAFWNDDSARKRERYG